MGRQKIEFDFLVNGVESAAQKLKGIEALNQSLSKGISAADLFKATGGNFSATTLAKNKDLFAQMGKDAGKSFDAGLKSSNSALGAFINQSMGIGAGQNRPNRANYAAFWQRAVPPFITPTASGAGGGGGSLNNILGGLGAGGGGLAGKILPVIDVLQALKMAAQYLKEAFDKLMEAVKRGAKLYTDSAKIGTRSGGLFQIRSALGAAGLSSGEVDSMLLNAQFAGMMQHGSSGMSPKSVQGNRGAGMSVNGTYLNALGAGQLAEAQQIKNLMYYVDKEWKDAAVDSELAAKNAKSLFLVNNQINKLKREWDTLWEELASALGTILLPAIESVKDQLKAFNLVIENSQIGQILRFIQGMSPNIDFQKVGTGGQQRISANAMQHMGFVFGQGGFHGDAVQETAKNTKISAMGIMKLVEILGHSAGDAVGKMLSWSATNP